MNERAIVEFLESRHQAVSLDLLRSSLSQVPYMSLRYHLARLEERGLIEMVGTTYRLATPSQRP